MTDDEKLGPAGLGDLGIDAVVHLRGDMPLVAQVGGRRVLVVTQAVDPHAAAEAFDLLGLRDVPNLIDAEDPPVTVFSPGGTPAVQNEADEDDDDEVPPTPFTPGGVPARVHLGMLMLDLDQALDPNAEPGDPWEARHLHWAPRKGAKGVDAAPEHVTD